MSNKDIDTVKEWWSSLSDEQAKEEVKRHGIMLHMLMAQIGGPGWEKYGRLSKQNSGEIE